MTAPFFRNIHEASAIIRRCEDHHCRGEGGEAEGGEVVLILSKTIGNGDKNNTSVLQLIVYIVNPGLHINIGKKMAEKPEFKEKPVRILWGSDEDLPALYSNHLYVSHAGDTEFHLVFGHLSPPLTMGMEESELPGAVIIKPVAKLVVSPKVMKAFLSILNENLEKFETKEGEE